MEIFRTIRFTCNLETNVAVALELFRQRFSAAEPRRLLLIAHSVLQKNFFYILVKRSALVTEWNSLL